ncbi:unnamed protein product [Gordionus sp. m RMFG-2023]
MNKIDLQVQTLTGHVFNLKALENDTILTLKTKILFKKNVPISQQHLIWKSNELTNSYTLNECGIQDGAILQLVLHLKGGPMLMRKLSLYKDAANLIKRANILEALIEQQHWDDGELSSEKNLKSNKLNSYNKNPDQNPEYRKKIYKDNTDSLSVNQLTFEESPKSCTSDNSPKSPSKSLSLKNLPNFLMAENDLSIDNIPLHDIPIYKNKNQSVIKNNNYATKIKNDKSDLKLCSVSIPTHNWICKTRISRPLLSPSEDMEYDEWDDEEVKSSSEYLNLNERPAKITYYNHNITNNPYKLSNRTCSFQSNNSINTSANYNSNILSTTLVGKRARENWITMTKMKALRQQMENLKLNRKPKRKYNFSHPWVNKYFNNVSNPSSSSPVNNGFNNSPNNFQKSHTITNPSYSHFINDDFIYTSKNSKDSKESNSSPLGQQSSSFRLSPDCITESQLKDYSSWIQRFDSTTTDQDEWDEYNTNSSSSCKEEENTNPLRIAKLDKSRSSPIDNDVATTFAKHLVDRIMIGQDILTPNTIDNNSNNVITSSQLPGPLSNEVTAPSDPSHNDVTSRDITSDECESSASPRGSASEEEETGPGARTQQRRSPRNHSTFTHQTYNKGYDKKSRPLHRSNFNSNNYSRMSSLAKPQNDMPLHQTFQNQNSHLNLLHDEAISANDSFEESTTILDNINNSACIRNRYIRERNDKTIENSIVKFENVSNNSVNNNRCFTCRKKTGIISSFNCRCGNEFCVLHRHPESHDCTFDYKVEGRKLMELANPKNCPTTIQKLHNL